jgi:arsenite methyltransferase
MMASKDVRDRVSKAYAEALRLSQEQSGTACCAPPTGEAAACCDYDGEIDTHREAGQSSFGCGNPLAMAGVGTGETVLDLGSGAGLDLLIAAGLVGPSGQVIGVDMTDVMIEAARKNVAQAGYENVEVRKGLIEALPIEDASVDHVISNCVVNLSPEKDKVFAEVHRVLKPGGRFSIFDIVAEDLPQELHDHPAAYSACITGALSLSDYLAGLRAAGLGSVDVAERMDYDAAQLRALILSDLEWSGEDQHALDGVFEQLVGKVASVRFVGRKA